MKFSKIYICCIATLVGLASCLSENPYAANSNNNGNLRLEVEIVQPEATTRAASDIDTRTFPVTIVDNSGKVVKEYSAQSEVPTLVPMEVGKYTVSAHQPGELLQKMDHPYYKGSKDIEILKGVTSDVDVLCKMANSCITINYSDDFFEAFDSWTVTVNDGSETALSFSSQDGVKSQSVYWLFKDNASLLTVNFSGTTKDGNKISATNFLAKSQATEKYDDGNECFTGGDAVTINVSPVESTEGYLESINITASVVFTETNENIDVDVWEGTPGETPGGNEGGDNTGGDDNPSTDDAITLTLPAPISYAIMGADDVDQSLGDTYLAAAKGLKSIKVSIESTSDDMISSLSDLYEQYGVDFITGAEIVGNQDVVLLFEELDQPLSVPAVGDKDYTFPIGNFFSLLQVLVGEHTFHLTVTDMDGVQKSGDVIITITMP
ncbi:MAG: DUF4493 domain-containing protein [Bacteroidaceae bacterium]|nr:DUF4493 domain-containing protein [Bacteroidaceae bacterium]